MLLRAIIIDDEQRGIDTLNILVEKHIDSLRVVAECTWAEEGVKLIENYKPEIVFLDINMPQMDGFELLKKLTWRDFNLVFTTAHPEYGLKALKNNAIDYLLKPIDPGDLAFAVNKIKQKMLEDQSTDERFNINELIRIVNQKQHFVLHTKSGIEHINLHEIVCFESFSNYTRIHLTGMREISSSKTLKEFDVQLCDQGSSFMRVHNSYIINLNKVASCLKTVDKIIMENGQKVPLSKSRKDSFYKWMGI